MEIESVSELTVQYVSHMTMCPVAGVADPVYCICMHRYPARMHSHSLYMDNVLVADLLHLQMSIRMQTNSEGCDSGAAREIEREKREILMLLDVVHIDTKMQ